MGTFLKFVAPASADERVLNVVSFREEPLEWVGEEAPSFSGELLSTQSNPRRSYTATVEFTDPTKVDDLLSFIASSLDAVTGRPMGFRKLNMASVSSPAGSGALRGASQKLVTVRMGAATPTDYVTPGAGAESTRITQSWQVELTIRDA